MSETLRYLQSESAETGVEIGTLVKYLLLDAVKAGASDIHIEPWESTLAVRIRLNGVLTELVHLPLEYMEKISGRFKVLANLVTYQTGLPQEGHAPADPELGGVEYHMGESSKDALSAQAGSRRKSRHTRQKSSLGGGDVGPSVARAAGAQSWGQ